MKKILLSLILSNLFICKSFAQINVTPSDGCVPLSVNVSTNPISNAMVYEWYDNGALVANGASANYNVTQAGYHNINLLVYDSSMVQIASDYSSINTYGFGSINSDIAANTTCLNDYTGFYLNTYIPDQSENISWDFGDGSPIVSGGNNWIEHSFSAIGNYTITATCSSSCGNQVVTYPITVSTNAPLGSVYIETPQDTVCPGDIVSFNTPGSYNNYVIDYGDGVQEFSTRDHVYNIAGTYTIRATYFNGCGNSAVATTTVVVSTNIGISSNINYFEMSDTLVCPTTNVYFYPPGSFANYTWDFGNGSSSSIYNPSTTYSSVGTYAVSLEVRNGCGYTKTINRNIYVQNNIPVDPFTIISPDSICPTTSALFMIPDDLSDDSDPPIYFNFGDGSTEIAQSQRQITHVYNTPGTYTVSATVVNGCGQSYTYTSSVVANNATLLDPNSFFAECPLQKSCPNDTVFFIVSPPDIGAFLFDYGDGTFGSTPSSYLSGPDGVTYAIFKHAYTNIGFYSTSVEITSPCGSVLTKPSGDITVSDNNPVDNDAGFFFDESKYYCLNEPIGFVAYGAHTYTWNFGDGSGDLISTGSLIPTYHAYAEPGTYSIKLVMQNSCGATDTFINEVLIPDSRVEINTSTVSSSCGQQNGKAIAVADGSNPPYSFSWTNGDHNFIADTLTAGIYYVTITDAKGCSNFAVATVSDQQAPTISVNNVIDASCNGQSSGAIDITLIGSSSPYTYIWSNGKTSEDINQLAAGPYELIVTDANGCVATKSIVIGEPEDFNISYVSYPSVCGFNTGVIQTSVQGNTGPYNYLWSNGYTGASVSGLGVGVYTVTVVDNNGCLKEKVTTVNEQNSPVMVLDSVSVLDCNISNGANVYVSTYLGASPYTYLWSNGSTLEDQVNLLPGFYSVMATGSNGCRSVLTTTIEESTPAGLSICAVTVDSLINTNRVIWEMYSRTDIESFNVYRESSQSGLYYLVANVDADSLHEYVDPAADPAIRGWRYKLSTVNFCGEESSLSDLHKTIHLTLNQGIGNNINLIWDNYEGLNFNEFFIWRYTTQNQWEKIDSIPSNLFSYTDATAPSTTVSPDLYYFIEGGPIVECDPTRGAINTSRSNIKSPSSVGAFGVKENGLLKEVSVYPNPNTGELNIRFIKPADEKTQIEICDAMGRALINKGIAVGTNLFKEDLSGLANGIYFVRITENSTNMTFKIVLSK